ncbi:molybdenum ABC transporter ATP-binding protein [Pontibacter sp. JAM-7]|uniref:molybdenum ABC transporter ATP-binding protein n=1 Tax=Pontibacter sp. JAM-7 TaxID=3366581 RepID=UPI003AF5828C
MTAERISLALQLQRDAFKLDVNLSLPGQGISVIFGPSGCGKTTLLRCIAGLETSAQGQVQMKSQQWQDTAHFMPVHQRPLGYVFQEASLLPHLSAEKNLRYAFKRSAKQQSGLWPRVIQLLALEPLLCRMPAQLSGGERQRVAIGRALLTQPDLLLMDEPLSSLDLPLKQEILPYLEQLQAEFNLPVIYVTHAMDEVARLADYLVVMDQGKVKAQGPLADILSQPEHSRYFGEETGVVIPANIKRREPEWHLMQAEFSGGRIWMADTGQALGEAVRLRILARDVSLSCTAEHSSTIQNRVEVELVEINPTQDPATALITLACGDSQLLARITHRAIAGLGLEPGQRLWAQIKSAALAY